MAREKLMSPLVVALLLAIGLVMSIPVIRTLKREVGMVHLLKEEPRPVLREAGKRDRDTAFIANVMRDYVAGEPVKEGDIEWVLAQLTLRTHVLEDIERVMLDPSIPPDSKVAATVTHIRQALDHGFARHAEDPEGDEPCLLEPEF